MEVKAVWGVMAIAGVLLVGAVQADSHEGGHTCNQTAMMACATIEFGVKLTVLKDNPNITFTMIKEACGVYKRAIECVKAAHCTEEAFIAAIDGLEEFKAEQSCSEMSYCYLNMTSCWRNYPALGEQLEKLEQSEADFNETLCPDVEGILDCWKEKLPERCHFFSAVATSVKGLQMYHRGCREASCAPLMQCHKKFVENQSPEVNFTPKDCMLFRNQTMCANDATRNQTCDITLPKGHPTPGNISEIVSQACELMDQDDNKAIYSCVAFNQCVGDEFEDINFFFLPEFCKTAQEVLGCAAENAQACLGMTNAPAFVKSVQRLSLKVAAMGCAPSKKLGLESCNKLPECKNKYRMLRGDGFNKSCRAIKAVQKCAGEAISECNLPLPAGAKYPKVDKMSAVTEKMCDAMEGKNLSTCKDYLDCLGTNEQPDDDNYGQLITGQSWCGASVQSMQCAKEFGDSCAISPELRKTLYRIYKEILDEGCTDTFDFLKDYDDGDGDTSDNGAQTQVAVSLSLMLLLSLVHSVLRLQ